MRINRTAGHLQDWITQVWVKATGRRFDPVADAWLPGPYVNDEAVLRAGHQLQFHGLIF